MVERVLQNIYVDPALVSSHTNLFDNSEECDFVIAYESDLLLSSKPSTIESFESIQPLTDIPVRQYAILATPEYTEKFKSVDFPSIFLTQTLGFGRDQEFLQVAADKRQDNFLAQLSPATLPLQWLTYAILTVWLLKQFIHVTRFPTRDNANQKIELRRI